MFSYYIFLLFYLIFWFISKCIFLLVLECKGGKVEIEQNPEPQPPYNNVNNIPNQIGSTDELNSNRKITEKPNNVINPDIIENNINNDFKIQNTNIIGNNGNITNNVINDINNIYKGNIYNNQVQINNHNDINTQKEINVNQQQDNIMNEIQNSENISFNEANQSKPNNDINNISPKILDLPGKEEVEQQGQIQKLSPDGENEKVIKNEDLNKENEPNAKKEEEVENNNNLEDAPVPGLFDEQV